MRSRGARWGPLLVAAAVLGVACSPEPPRPRNVVLISVDTLRADRLGSYGHAGAGTPNLDRLARMGTRFENAMAPSPLTLPSHASLLSGLDPREHGIRHNGLFALSPEVTTLAERLRSGGFRTGAFVASVVLHPRHGLDQGFERYALGRSERYALGRSERPGGAFLLKERSAPEVIQDAFEWLDGLGPDEPFLLFVHFMEPHAPYDPPEPEVTRYAGDRYQGEISAVDRAAGALLDGIHARARLADTLVIVTSDHGESLGEHGEESHGFFLYQSTLHVPLLVAGPGIRAEHVVSEPVGLVDVVPTVLDVLGLPGREAPSGRSLLPALRGGALREAPLYAESWPPRLDYGWSPLFALRRGDAKWIDAPRPELYDLSRDPGEASNRADARPEEARALAEELAALRAAAIAAPRTELGAAESEALRELGYLSGVHEGTQGAGLADPKDRIELVAAMDQASDAALLGRTEEAEAMLADLVTRHPEMYDARLRRVALLMRLRRFDEARQEATSLSEALAPIPHGARVASRALALLGILHSAAGEDEAAVAAFERALVAPQPASIRRELARVYRRLGREADAAALEASDPSPNR